MIEPGQIVSAAVSGGPDSTALLYILLELRNELGFFLRVCHFDHAIRDESPDDMAHVKQLAGKLGLRYATARAMVPPDAKITQELARDLRYRFFERQVRLGHADLIALGHTLDDSVETSIMWMLRGTGPSAFGGIPPVRDHYIRPLIDLCKGDITRWLDGNGIKYLTDPSNESDKYLRNSIRRNIISVMERTVTGSVDSIARLAKLVQDQNSILEKQAQEFVEANGASQSSLLTLDTPLLRAQPEAMRFVIYRVAIRTTGLNPSLLTFRHMEAIDGLLTTGTLGKKIDLPQGNMAMLDHAGLSLGKEPAQFEFPETAFNCPLLLETTCGTLSVSAADNDSDDALLMDAEKIPDGAVFRTRQAGDFLKLANTEGRKSLKKFFIDRKVPSGRRDKILLLAADSEVVWIPGLFAAPSIVADENCGQAVKIRWDQAG